VFCYDLRCPAHKSWVWGTPNQRIYSLWAHMQPSVWMLLCMPRRHTTLEPCVYPKVLSAFCLIPGQDDILLRTTNMPLSNVRLLVPDFLLANHFRKPQACVRWFEQGMPFVQNQSLLTLTYYCLRSGKWPIVMLKRTAICSEQALVLPNEKIHDYPTANTRSLKCTRLISLFVRNVVQQIKRRAYFQR